MILYKYLPPARIDVILNCKIRFTQYGDFNDPFELNPNINKIAEESEIKELVKKNFVKLIEEEYSNNPIINAFISKEAFIQLALAREDMVKNAVVDIEPSIVALLPRMLQMAANSLLGALSLSEYYDHELMWSHYSEEHKGYAIGFAYETGSELRQGLKHWIEKYNTSRPHSSLDDRTPHEAYWQKPRPGYAGRPLKLAA